MENEKDLFAACRLLFGEEIVISWEFLGYLREEGIAGAFRKKSLELHPDRSLFSGLSSAEAQSQFVLLQNSCQILRQYVNARQARCSTAHLNEESGTKSDRVYGKVLPEKQLLFGRFLYHTGLIDFQQIVQALAWQKSGRRRIGELAVTLGYLKQSSVKVILNRSHGKRKFGLTAWELGLLSQDEIQKLLQYQRRQQKKIGQFFVEQGVINRVELKILLSRWKAHNRQVQSIVDGGKRMSTDERRKNSRVPFCTTVDLSFGDASFADCATENLSTQGVFVDNIPHRSLGDGCHVTLKLTGSSANITLSIQAEVVRLTKDGVGLHFTDIDLDSYSHLRQIIYYNSENIETTDEVLQ